MNRLFEKLKAFRQDIAACAVIAVALLLMFGRAAGYGGDIWDDMSYLGIFREDVSFSQLLRLIRQPVLELFSPLVVFSFYLDRILFFSGDAVAAAHKWNLFYFILGAWGLYTLFREIHLPGAGQEKRSLSPFWAMMGVLLWALHPQRVESVVWIAERKDVLLACCTWWSWVLFIRGFRRERFSYGAFLLFLLSFGIKPMLMLFPLVLGVWIYVETRSLKWRDYRFIFPLTAVSVIYLVFWAAGTFIEGGGNVKPGGAAVFLWNLGNYGVTALFPVGAAPFHPFYPEPGWGNFLIVCFFLAVYLAGMLFLPKYRDGVLIPVGAAMICFGLLLAPVIGIGRIGNADWADRYNLLPSAMAVLVLTAWAAGMQQHCKSCVRIAGICFFCALLLWGAVQCHFLVPVWKNAETVICEVLKVPRPNYRVIFVAAVRALEKGDEKKFDELSACIRPDNKMVPYDAEAVRIFHMATAAQWDFQKKKPGEALGKTIRLLEDPSWKKITLITDGFPQMLLGQAAEVYLRNRQFSQAAFVFERLALCYPGTMEEFFYRGLALIFLKKYADAVPVLEKAEKLAPKDSSVKFQLDFARRKAVAAR